MLTQQELEAAVTAAEHWPGTIPGEYLGSVNGAPYNPSAVELDWFFLGIGVPIPIEVPG